MIYLIWFLSLLAAFFLGYKFGDLTKKVKAVEQAVKQKLDKKPAKIQQEPVSSIIDPLDEIQTAIYERNKMMEKLNPNE